MTNRLGRLLFVTLEAVRVDAELPVLAALRLWLNSWRGIGGGKVYALASRVEALSARGKFLPVRVELVRRLVEPYSGTGTEAGP